mgnify:CR=1 FL=1
MRKTLPVLVLLLAMVSPAIGGPEDSAPPPVPSKQVSPKQFKAMLEGKLKIEVENLLGEPARVLPFGGDAAGLWQYGFPVDGKALPVMKGLVVYDERSGKTAYHIQVFFVGGKYKNATATFGTR